jgi:hypothetical protein
MVRFLVEFVRSDDRGGAFFLSTSQLIGLSLAGLAVVAHLRLVSRGKGGGGTAAPLPA